MVSKKTRKTLGIDVRRLQHRTQNLEFGIFQHSVQRKAKKLVIATWRWRHRTELWQFEDYHVEDAPTGFGHCLHEQAKTCMGERTSTTTHAVKRNYLTPCLPT